MPCRDWEGVAESGYSSSEYHALQHRCDKLARMLCEVMTHCCGKGLIDAGVFSKETQEWWIKHQEDDRNNRKLEAAKKKREEAEKERKKQRQELINKMSPEERKILGL